MSAFHVFEFQATSWSFQITKLPFCISLGNQLHGLYVSRTSNRNCTDIIPHCWFKSSKNGYVSDFLIKIKLLPIWTFLYYILLSDALITLLYFQAMFRLWCNWNQDETRMFFSLSSILQLLYVDLYQCWIDGCFTQTIVPLCLFFIHLHGIILTMLVWWLDFKENISFWILVSKGAENC